MSIFDRIQRIAKANVNWLLDKVETPESELESKIKELEDALVEGRQAAATYGATFRRMEIEAQALAKQQDELQRKARAALAAGDEPLARKALEDKLLAGQRAAALAPGIEQGRKSYQTLTDNLGKLQQQLKAAKAKLAELVSRQKAADAQKTFGKYFDRSTAATVDGAAFERMEDQVLQAEAEAQIGEEIRRGTVSDLDLEQRSRDLQVEAELRAMKEEAR
jgi:phage shock protein A